METLILKICLEGDIDAAQELIKKTPREKILGNFFANSIYSIGEQSVPLRELFILNFFDFFLALLPEDEFLELKKIILND